jgi:hypothetical protein
MEEAKREQIVDVGSVVETLSADASGDAPLYTLESLCMRCHQNVLITSPPFFRVFIHFSSWTIFQLRNPLYFFTLFFVFSSFIHDERINFFPNFSSYFFNTMCVVSCFSIPGFNNLHWKLLLALLFLCEFGVIVFLGFNFTASSN